MIVDIATRQATSGASVKDQVEIARKKAEPQVEFSTNSLQRLIADALLLFLKRVNAERKANHPLSLIQYGPGIPVDSA